MSFAEYTVFGGDPLAVIERRRRSPLGLSGAVGAAAAADDDDATDDEEREDGAPSAEGEGRRAPRRAAPARKTGVRPPENDREDLVRVRRALQESTAPGADLAFGRTVGGPDDGALGAAPVLAQSAARALRRFQAAAGLKVDGLARPGGPTDAALDNRRRRVWRLAAQGRRPEDETLDDRLAVFLQDRARRRRIAEDDLAALSESRTGRLHLIRLARTTDPETARPILARELDRLRAERAARAKSPPDDGSRPLPGDGDGRAPGRPGPPDDGSRPMPGDGGGRAPGYPGPPDDGFRPPPDGDDDGRPPGLPGPPDDGSRPLPDDKPPPPDPDDDEPEDDCPTQEEIDALKASAAKVRERVREAEEKVAARLREAAAAEASIQTEKVNAAKAGLDVGLCLLNLNAARAAACILRTAGVAGGALILTLYRLDTAQDALRAAEQEMNEAREELEALEAEIEALEEKRRVCRDKGHGAAVPSDQSAEVEYRRNR